MKITQDNCRNWLVQTESNARNFIIKGENHRGNTSVVIIQ